MEAISELGDNKPVVNFINRYRRKDGTYCYIEWRSMPKGDLIYAAARDITEHIEHEKSLENKRSDLTAFINNLPFLAWFKDKDGRFIAVNDKFAQSCGYESADMVVGKTDFDIWPKDLAKMYREDDNEAIKTRLKKNVEELINDNGEIKWFETYKAPRFDENGSPIGTVGIARDISDRKSIEEKNKNQFALIESLLDSIPDLIFYKDVNGVYLGCNPSFAEFVGKKREEILGKTDYDLFSKEVADNFRENDVIMLEKLNLRHNEEWISYPDGRKILIDTLKTPYWGPDKKLLGVLGISRDITERYKAELSLRENEERINSLLKSMNDMVFVLDNDLNFKEYRRPDNENLLFNPEYFIGKNFSEIGFPEPAHGVINTALDESLKTALPQEIEYYLDTPEGKNWFNMRITRLKGGAGEYSGFTCVARDITRRKADEERIKASEINFRTFFETIDDMIFISNKEGEIFYTNSAVWAKLGYSPEELKGAHILDVHPVDKRSEARLIFEDMFAGKTDSCPLPLARKDGSFIPVETRVWFGKWDGKDAIFGISKDLSKEQESLQMFNKIFDNNPALMALSALPDRKFVNVNQSFLNNLKFDREDVINKTALELNLFVDQNKQIEISDELKKTNRINNIELKVRTKNGELLTGLFSGEVIETQGKLYFLTVMTDITAQKKAEEKINYYSEMQDILINISKKYINVELSKVDETINFSLAEMGKFVGADRAYIFDYDFENNLTSNAYEWVGENITPEIQNLQKVPLENIPQWLEKHKNGEEFYIYDVSELPDDGELGLKNILESQEIKSLITVPLLNENNLIGFVGFDSVKERHAYTSKEKSLLLVFAQMLVNLKNRISIAEKLTLAKEQAEAGSKAKSEFLANMSHEIRTPLNSVVGFSELLKNTPLTKNQRDFIENVNTSAISLLGIINDILDFSKIEAGRLELDLIKTDVINLIEQSSDVVKHMASQKRLELLLNISTNLPRFAILDPVRLKQILINLLNNAIKFTEKGEVELKVEFVQIDEKIGKYYFAVRDTGIGISEEQRMKLFKAFSQADSSTTRKFGGTGLGLTISNYLVEKMGGDISLTSVPGKGSVFSFTIETGYEKGDSIDKGGLDVKRVLVIDDNDNNRKILQVILEGWGLNFTGCDNGLSALKLIETSEPFDVIIVDYLMPYLDGIETIRMMREKMNLPIDQRPAIILFSSAENSELYEKCKKLGVKFNISKPVKSGDLYKYLLNINNQTVSDSYSKKADEISYNSIKSITNKQSTILIAEDVATNMELVKSMITQFIPQANIIEAHNGKAAVDIALKIK